MRRLLCGSAGLAAIAVLIRVSRGPASASTTRTQLTRAQLPALASNQGQVIAPNGLNVRALAGGQTPSTSLPPKGYLAYHQVVTIRCYYTGQTITGPYGPTNIWDSIIGYQTTTDGVASDAWIYTGSNTPKVPPCGGP